MREEKTSNFILSQPILSLKIGLASETPKIIICTILLICILCFITTTLLPIFAPIWLVDLLEFSIVFNLKWQATAFDPTKLPTPTNRQTCLKGAYLATFPVPFIYVQPLVWSLGLLAKENELGYIYIYIYLNFISHFLPLLSQWSSPCGHV